MWIPNWLRLRQRQALLFLITILVPCLVLVTLGWHMMQQETQLDEKRALEDHQQKVRQFRRELLSQLENLKLRQVAAGIAQPGVAERPVEKSVVLVAHVRDGRLRLPWDEDSGAAQFRRRMKEIPFAARLRQAAAEESAERWEKAAGIYRESLPAAKSSEQQAFARLLLARALEKSGHAEQSQIECERLAELPIDLVDEHGVPLALYGAVRLDVSASRSRVAGAVRAAAQSQRWLPPAALYLARDLTRSLGDAPVERMLHEQAQDREQAEALQADFARILPGWSTYGEPSWLVGTASLPGRPDSLAVAVRAREAVAAVDPGVRLAGAEGEALGEDFPGMRVSLPAAPAAASGQRQRLLLSAVGLALALTLLAAYLLWRDVRREVQIAVLRAQFVSSVTHELKTPLTSIRMFAETMLLDPEMDRRGQSEYLDTILSESERLSRLVDNVLNFARIEQGKRIYERKPVRLDEVVAGAVRVMQYPLRQSGFELDLHVDPGVPAVEADRDALQQAILNLLANAMKYSGASRRIGVDLRRENGRALIGVIDHGIGIAEEEQSRIFERFYRAPTSENRHVPGAGLGLTLVAHIVRAHGGDVAVESNPGAGSTFTIRLPLGDRSENGHGTHPDR